MKIKVLFFAHLKDLFGASEKDLQVNDNSTVRDVIEHLSHESNGLDVGSLRFAVNEAFVDLDQALKNQDTLAFLPPVSGG